MSLQPSSRLSIVIPTYNRAEFLDFSLEIHVPLAREYGVQIFISDNASTDNTAEVVEKWMEEYPLIRYHRNASNLGPDGNFELALKLPGTDYIWLLGDTYRLPDNGIKYALDLFDTGKLYDAVVVNLVDKLSFSAKDYADGSDLLGDLGGLMSCLSCLIYSRGLIAGANFQRYRDTYFIQTGIIFEYVASKDFLVHWAGPVSVRALSNSVLQKSSWADTSRVFYIGAEKWANFIFSLPPSYLLKSKIKSCVDFGKVSGIFTLKNLIIMRMAGLLTHEVYVEFKYVFGITLGFPRFFVGIISLVPRIFFKSLAFIVIVGFLDGKAEKLKKLFGA